MQANIGLTYVYLTVSVNTTRRIRFLFQLFYYESATQSEKCPILTSLISKV